MSFLSRFWKMISRIFESRLLPFNHSYGEECPICLEIFGELDNSADLCTLKCGHSFHIKCVTGWYSKQHNCPTCRGEIRYHFPH